MAQPSKRKIIKNKKDTVKKTVKKESNTINRLPNQKNIKTKAQRKRKHPEYGTSKLEERFAKNFLEKLNVEYIYQFKAESIGRYYDFYIPRFNICIEIDGDYYHSYNLMKEEMNPMQKHNKRVDAVKDHWAISNGILLLRIWEHDINKHPEKVMQMLKETFCMAEKENNIKNEMKKRH